MIRASVVAAGMAVLLSFALVGAAAAEGEGDYQLIQPIQYEAGSVTTVYTLTNLGTLTATVGQGFYVQTGDSSSFPYRLVYQDASRPLATNASETFTVQQFAGSWIETPDTLIVSSSQPLTIALSVKSMSPAEPSNLWVPMLVNTVPAPAVGVTLVTHEYKYVIEGKCYTYYIAREWVELCEPDETRYSIVVQVPMTVSAMWLERFDEDQDEVRTQMWRSPAGVEGHVLFRPPFLGAPTTQPYRFEYTTDEGKFFADYDPECVWQEGETKPACWTFPVPD